MLKRIVTISAVFFVNIILLASIIIPHHHHENEVCVVVTHCNSVEHSHDNDIASHEHKADNSGYCALSQSFIISNDNGKQELNFTFLRNNTLFETTLDDFSEEKESPIALLFQHPPEDNSSYNATISQNKGLRGPPTV